MSFVIVFRRSCRACVRISCSFVGWFVVFLYCTEIDTPPARLGILEKLLGPDVSGVEFECLLERSDGVAVLRELYEDRAQFGLVLRVFGIELCRLAKSFLCLLVFVQLVV